jgi:hypothetical protein
VQLERELLHEQTDDRTDDFAEHIAWVARTLVAMGPDLAVSMSATQRIRGDEADKIQSLLPLLAAQYGLRGRMDQENGSVTVTFERGKK